MSGADFGAESFPRQPDPTEWNWFSVVWVIIAFSFVVIAAAGITISLVCITDWVSGR
jgi:hypothetical protein